MDNGRRHPWGNEELECGPSYLNWPWQTSPWYFVTSSSSVFFIRPEKCRWKGRDTREEEGVTRGRATVTGTTEAKKEMSTGCDDGGDQPEHRRIGQESQSNRRNRSTNNSSSGSSSLWTCQVATVDSAGRQEAARTSTLRP
ncbi:hypothetical protein RUM44_000546 [Polyplax serrata]|uniref:Uncharacterized protein n=1 Tax=Polyplax serrata TaxID=468196 RepID=A0ABR1B8N0_POLSC